MNPVHFILRNFIRLYHGSGLFCSIVLLGASAVSCSGSNEEENGNQEEAKRAEYIGRLSTDRLTIAPLQLVTFEEYPWRISYSAERRKITKENFRCRGNSTNSDKVIQQQGETTLLLDCGGIEAHSLPLRENKEFIYPILIDLLNDIQMKTKKRVVITSGHRCPQHNRYNDPAPKEQYSKHMIGAEVAFYVEGLEEYPERVVKLLQDYYLEHEEYNEDRDYLEFKRWDKQGQVIETQPWYNKEIFIKLFKKHEGRDVDNAHVFPYVSVQVRYDRALKKNVSYTWEGAHQNYWRW